MNRFAGAVFGNGVTDYMSMVDPGFDAIGGRGVMEAGMDTANRLKNEGKQTYYQEQADSKLKMAEDGIESMKGMQGAADSAFLTSTLVDGLGAIGSFGLKGGFGGGSRGGGGGLGNFGTNLGGLAAGKSFGSNF
tara:strand:- start:348 stop:749 length:402 start_codon:yes stop_codon:yes gene_type:complete